MSESEVSILWKRECRGEKNLLNTNEEEVSGVYQMAQHKFDPRFE